ncbi:MAG: FKBP-type peptidyl-prolyl cis-trans isomerase [Bacteroidota bacterium]
MKNISKITLTGIVAILAITACKNSPYPGYEQSESGLYSKFYKQDEKGVKPVEGDVVRISLMVKNSTDSVLTDSKDPKFNQPGKTYYEFPLMKSEFNGSLEEALLTMSVGDSASFLISIDSMYKSKEAPAFLKKGTMLTYEVALQKITAKAEVEKEQQKKMEEQKVMMELRKNEEPKLLAKYLEDNKITTKPNESGLYYIEKVKGKGPKPTAGSLVKVNYTGRLLDGTVFDTSDEATAKAAGVFDERRPYEPIDFAVGQGQVIPGWDEGLMLMSAGTKAQFILPSAIAYGERGQGPIAPFSPLVFDVELISFGPGEAAPEMKYQEKDYK